LLPRLSLSHCTTTNFGWPLIIAALAASGALLCGT
jgi:hypothetical protein